MSEPYRTRDFHPVAPDQRHRKTRVGVRIIVTDGTHVLLMRDTDPGLPGSRWYMTPGGGVDPGETGPQAAVRELWEETGLRVNQADLGAPVMRRVVVHGYSDQICAQTEEFYVLYTPRFTPQPGGLTDEELVTLDGHAWLPLTGLDAADAPVWPLALAEVLDRAQAGLPLWDMGEVEESTVPVDAA